MQFWSVLQLLLNKYKKQYTKQVLLNKYKAKYLLNKVQKQRGVILTSFRSYITHAKILVRDVRVGVKYASNVERWNLKE